MSFKTKLEKYAKLIVQSGLNVQEKQTVVISASIESCQLVREVTSQAYLVGAKEVVVHYSDEEVTRMKYENMEVDELFIKSLDINGNKTIEAEDLTLIRGVLYEEQII